jgi:8-oxo-dGTP diphosphatase
MIYASLIILINKKKVLLLRRSEKVDSGEGLWCFPGGRVEPDETSLDAAIRELKEEVNLNVKAKNLAYVFTMRKDEDKDIIFYISDKWSGTPKVNWESDEYGWFEPKNFPVNKMLPCPPMVLELIDSWIDMFNSENQ